jgi:cell division protein FtsA
VLSADEREMGTLLIDIGGGTSDLMLYQDGSPFYTNVVPLGGTQVTSDISILLRTPFESAERLKITAGCCYPGLIEDFDAPALLPGLGLRIPVEIDRRQLCSYIQPRMSEIFTMIKEKVEREAQVRSWQALGGGVVLTGGGAMLSGAVELAQEIFGTTARVGIPYGLGGVIQEYQKPDLSTAVGLIRHAAANLGGDALELPGKEKRPRKSMDGLRNLFRNFFE